MLLAFSVSMLTYATSLPSFFAASTIFGSAAPLWLAAANTVRITAQRLVLMFFDESFGSLRRLAVTPATISSQVGNGKLKIYGAHRTYAVTAAK